MKLNLNGILVRSLNREDGKKIIDFFIKHGYTTFCRGVSYGGNSSYGIISESDKDFVRCYNTSSLSSTQKQCVKIISIKEMYALEEKSLPRYMMCWDHDVTKKAKVLVVHIDNQLKCPYIAVLLPQAERYIKKEIKCNIVTYKFAEEIPEEIKELTIIQAEEILSEKLNEKVKII